MEVLSLLPATALGYLTFRATSHPSSRIRKKLPNVKVKRIQVFPVVRLHVFNRVIHLHHWFTFSLILASSPFANLGILEHIFTKGLLLGGIIQGLTLPRGHRSIVYRDPSYERLTQVV